jgi:DNA repair ATPase RecN
VAGPSPTTGVLAVLSIWRKGAYVICGASETGKSFIVEAIDYLMGGSDPLRDIPV